MVERPRVALSVGGSIIATDDIDVEYLRGLASIVGEASESRDMLVVVGGGRISRRYISACRALGADEGFLDWVGIDSTRLNARLLIAALRSRAYHGVPKDLHEALDASKDFPIVVMGGTHPGHTTDAVCAMLAELARASELVVLTNVEGVYTADPRSDPDAVMLPKVGASELVRIVSEGSRAAGSPNVVDPMAARIIERAGIQAKVLDGRDLEQVANALSGQEFRGTLVVPGAEGEGP
jgi:uridylate kinase